MTLKPGSYRATVVLSREGISIPWATHADVDHIQGLAKAKQILRTTVSAHPLAAEHNQPWPGGRTNHYYFDLNRDWLALTQPETRGHVAAILEWYPQVVVDLHEMGGNSTYYFAPEAVPYNPHITQTQREALEAYIATESG